MKLFSHEEIKDKAIGKIGSPKRDLFEVEFRIELLQKKIKDDDVSDIFELLSETKSYLRNAKYSLPADTCAKFEKELKSIENRLKRYVKR